jgi:predicted nucleic acid-binding protein
MTLLDASIIIDVLRAKDVQLLRELVAVGGAVCGVTRAEILAGARGSKDRASFLRFSMDFNKSLFLMHFGMRLVIHRLSFALPE